MTTYDPSEATGQVSGDLVVLVHGLAACRATMKVLELRLRQCGFRTLNWGYPSIRSSIEELSESLGEQLQRLDADAQVSRLHLVTHSMGSILARSALSRLQLSRLGRVVMLGPPHAGSRVATNLAKFLGWYCHPLRQLSDHPSSFVNRLTVPDGYEFGVIAALRDRVVRLESTHLPRQADHVVVNSGHTTMLFRKDVAELVRSFLESGRFCQPALADSKLISAH